jgi:twitching motility protein PilJ
MTDASQLTQRLLLALVLLAILGGLTYQVTLAGVEALLEPVALLLEGAVVTVALFGFTAVRAGRSALDGEMAEREQMERALRQLVDDIGSFAEGDLRVRASAADNATGSLAEVLNAAVDRLIELASVMDSAAGRARAAAADAGSVSLELAGAAESQATVMERLGASIEDLAGFIARVRERVGSGADAATRGAALAAANARSARQAEAHLGDVNGPLAGSIGAVQRIGAASAEIGEIVDLINDIADQTNILALNAAIQASMAGDAGRGFAVVADEVQRLAERSTAATKQIAGLADTVREDAGSATQWLDRVQAESGLAQVQGLVANADELAATALGLASLMENIGADVRAQAQPSADLLRLLGEMRQTAVRSSGAAQRVRPAAAELASALADVGALSDHFVLPPARAAD